jgi:hypothetical protein
VPDRFGDPDADAGPTGPDVDDDLDDTGIDAVDGDPWDDEDDGDERLGLDGGAAVGRAPICGFCGVTMLPADPSNVIDVEFVCDNDDCDNFRNRA